MEQRKEESITLQSVNGRSQSIEELIRLGLKTYEAKGYVALLGRDAFTAAEVARRAGVPRARIYDVMKSLIDRGIATSRAGDVVRYVAVPPSEAIDKLVDDHRARMNEIEHTGTALVDRLQPEYHSGREHTEPLDFIEILRGTEAIARFGAEMASRVQDELLVFTKPPLSMPHQNVEGLEGLTRYRTLSVYETELLTDPDYLAGIQQFIQGGEEARFVDELPLKMALVDNSLVVFELQEPVASGGEPTMMVVKHNSLAKALRVTFETIWEQGVELNEALEGLADESAS